MVGEAPTSNIKYVESKFSTYKFEKTISDRKILFQCIKMDNSALILINDKDNYQFVDLSLALRKNADTEPLSTSLLGGFGENSSVSLSNRISKKLGKTVYVSFNLEQDRLLVPMVEKCLYDEIKKSPERF